MLTYVRLRIAFVTSRRVGKLRPLKFDIDHTYDPAEARLRKGYLIDWTAAIKNTLFSGGTHVVDHVWRRRHKIC